MKKYNGPGGDVAIPKGVTKIGDWAFSGCTGLTCVTIPASVTKIGVRAFKDCTGLQCVDIPASVTKIESFTFWGCTGLQSVTIPTSVTKIESSAFGDCTGLQSVTIPAGVMEIENSPFQGCTGLTEILVDAQNPVYRSENGMLVENDSLFLCPEGNTGDIVIPEGVTEIGWRAFKDCTGMQSVTIPASVTKIESSAFGGCTGLQSVSIPESVTVIMDSAFEGCTGLTEILVDAKSPAYRSENGMLVEKGSILLCPEGKTGDVIIPEGVTKIGWKSFQNCVKLRSVSIPESVTVIENVAFQHCIGLQSVHIPASITKIEWCAFEGCTELRSVAIPENVTKIDKSVFKNCSPVLIAPHIPLADFDNANKPGACCGFARRYLEKAELNEEIKAGYLKYIKGQKKKLYPVAVEHEELLHLMFAEKFVTRRDIDLLLEECDRQNNVSAKAAVLEYAGRNLKPADPLKEFKLEGL